MADITIVNGIYKPTYNWGAPSCICDIHHFWIAYIYIMIDRHTYIHIYIYNMVGGLEHGCYFPSYAGDVILPIDFHIFQDGYGTTNQGLYFL